MFLDIRLIAEYGHNKSLSSLSIEETTKKLFEQSSKFQLDTQYIIKVDDKIDTSMYRDSCVYKVNNKLDKVLPFLHKKYITSYVIYSNVNYQDALRKFMNDKRYDQKYLYVCIVDNHNKTYDIYEVY